MCNAGYTPMERCRMPNNVSAQAMNGEKEQPILSVRDLHTWFEIRRWGILKAGEVRALDGVDFDLHRGEAISVVGESGCGKSTLAKTILALHKPTQGEIRFQGRKMSEFTKEEMKAYRAEVGY